jgi:hypothetical protein
MQALSQLSYTPKCCLTVLTPCFASVDQLEPSSKDQLLAEWTGLEPATPGVTGRYSNQLNYHSRYADD